ncbi:MAG: Nif3-like dinuclear metal center hexameric protein, partial [Desulfobacterales bacterium]|nr:Nif3-like dinuclear metal center hexameric protein [Desulfobacterales bacterium]
LQKLVVFVPEGYEQNILNALFASGAGIIGHYSCCSFSCKGKGTFKPEKDANPFTGIQGQLSHQDEYRIETVVEKQNTSTVIETIRAHHPYEEVAIDVYPLSDSQNTEGMGRIGLLSSSLSLIEFAKQIKTNLALPYVRIVGNHDLMVNQVALIAGSGSGLLKSFFYSNAQVFISGDIKYHDARDVEMRGLGLIDIGHFGSEKSMIMDLSKKLDVLLKKVGFECQIVPCILEKEPFEVIS